MVVAPMNRSFIRRINILASLVVAAVGLLAIGAIVLRSIERRSPVQHQFISLEKQGDWEAFGGTWEFADGVMSNNSDERGAKLMTGPENWTNYSVEADVLLLGQYGDAGLIIRASDEEKGVDSYHGYMAGLRDLDNTLMMGRADYGWREYADKAVPRRVLAQQWYHLKVLAFDCDFAVSATSQQGETTTVAIRDPGCIKSGRFGLKSYNTGAQWKNVEVRPTTQQDLASMIGDLHPQLAVARQFPEGSEPVPRDQYLEPLERDLQAHRSQLNAQAIDSLRLLSPNGPSSVIVQGVVTLTSPMFYIQDSTGGLAIQSSHPHAPLQIGDEVEVRGDAYLHDFSSELHNADIHVLWSHTPVSPIAVATSQAATGAFDAQYVEVEGRLEERSQNGSGAEVLTMEDGSQSFFAIVNGLGRSLNPDELKLKSRLRLRGICVTDPKYTHDLTAFAILLPSSGDIEVMEGPPLWSPVHIVELATGILILTIAGITGFVFVERWRMQAVLDERQRLAHEMHDTLSQSFAGLGFQLQAIRDDVKDGIDITSQLELARDMVRDSHEEARRSISALRPEHLESVGLLSALEDCARRMISQCSSIEIKTISKGNVLNIPLRVSDTLLRIGYEALANTIRHSKCSRLTISLVYLKSAVEMIIEDDGVGFLVSSDSAGFGVRGMHKRADNISAQFRIDSEPGRGTAVHVLAPLPPSFIRAISHGWLIQVRKNYVERTRF